MKLKSYNKFISYTLALVAALLVGSGLAQAGPRHSSGSKSESSSKPVVVRTYTKKDGTVVNEHTRALPSTATKDTSSPSKLTVPASTTGTVKRDANGKIERSQSARHEFMKLTGYPHGRPGYVIDHIVPLKRGGCDCPANMQWQTIADAKAKDKTE